MIAAAPEVMCDFVARKATVTAPGTNASAMLSHLSDEIFIAGYLFRAASIASHSASGMSA